MSDTNSTPLDPDTGLPIEEESPVGGGGESVSPPEDPTPPDTAIGDAAGEGSEDTLLSPDLAGDSLIEGGDELGGAGTVLENDELDGDVER